MKKLLLFLLLTPSFIPVNAQAQAPEESTHSSMYKVHYDPVDSEEARRIDSWLKEGHENIIDFFRLDYKQPFDVYLFSDRDSLDKQWQKDWNMPAFKSQCWMVASGVAYRLDILTPRIWNVQACEHDPKDTIATKKIIFHEMIHVFHGQQNPSPTFTDIDNIDWFVEGIAVYASGQLDDKRYTDARNFVLESGGPDKLAEVWTGNNKYGLAGSLVRYIDSSFGRTAVVHLLGLTTADQMLDYLKLTEEELISNWKTDLRSNEFVHDKK